MSDPIATPRSARRRRRLFAAVVAAVTTIGTSITLAVSADAAVPPAPTGMTLVFSDDFSGAAGTGLNRSNWLYDIGTSYPGGAPNWGTGEIETMTDSTANVYHDGQGRLAIKPIRDAAGNWTSGRVETQRTDFGAPPGGKVRIQASLQQPNVSGPEAAGYWSAFWAMGAPARPVGATNWPSIGEWDVMEGINGRGTTFGTLHCGVVSGGPCNEQTGYGSGERPCPGCLTSFHTYAVEMDRSVQPEQLRWYLDGNLFFTINSTEIETTAWNNATRNGMFVILNVAIGGGFPAAFGGGPTAQTRSGVPMLVDYVAVYKSAGGTTTPPTTQPTSRPPTTAPTSQPTTSPTAKPTTSPTTKPPAGGRDAYRTIEAESYNGSAGVVREPASGGGQNIGSLANGDWARFDNVDFGTGGVRDFVARVASGASGGVSGLVEVRIGSRSNPPIGSIAVGNTGGWQSWRSVPGNVSNVTGRQTVFLTFTSGQPAEFVNVDWFHFRR